MRIVFLLLTFIVAGSATAQKCSIKNADKKFDAKEYFAAIDFYKCAYKDIKPAERGECLWRIGECYRLIDDYKQAAINYQKAIKANCRESATAKLYLTDSTQMRKDWRPPRYIQIAKDRSVAELVDSLISGKRVECAGITYSGRKSTQYEVYMALSLRATDAELVALADHKNGVVRCYAFEALSKRTTVDLFPILMAHINDDELVNTFCGCEGG